jgi:hypothetical protein
VGDFETVYELGFVLKGKIALTADKYQYAVQAVSEAVREMLSDPELHDTVAQKGCLLRQDLEVVSLDVIPATSLPT